MQELLIVLSSKKGISNILLFIIIFVFLLIFSLFFVVKKTGISLERNSPIIKVTNLPKGIGNIPTKLSLDFEDSDSGLNDYIIRLISKRNSKILKKENLEGKKNASIEILLNDKSLFQNSSKIELEIKVFDKSFWSNKSEENLEFIVDYDKPSINILSTQHNIQTGGSQLAIYQASDEMLILSGIKVGNKIYRGFQAENLDSDFGESLNNFISIFAVPSQENLKLFSEDKVGNTNSKNINYKIFDTQYTNNIWNFSEATLRNFIDKFVNKSDIHNLAGKEKLLKGFSLIYGSQRNLDSNKIEKILDQTKDKKIWNGIFIQPAESIRTAFGTKISFKLEDELLGSGIMTGYEFSGDSVYAANDGIVLYAEDLGTYGKTIIVDHGLGVSTVYGYLDSIETKPGVKVEKGEVIGNIGKTGLARSNLLLFEMRIQGTPVDAREWWNKDWYNGHFKDKLSDVKYNSGINNTNSFE